MEMRPRSTHRPLFKTKNIDSSLEYILSLMKFLVNNLEYFSFKYTIHTKHTRKRMSMHMPQTTFILSKRCLLHECKTFLINFPNIYLTL